MFQTLKLQQDHYSSFYFLVSMQLFHRWRLGRVNIRHSLAFPNCPEEYDIRRI